MGSALVVGVGASGGLGAALCRRFARAGLHVVVSGRSADKLEKVASEIRDAGGEATAVVADATVAAAVAAAFDAAEAAGGPPELVVYNAASTPFHPLLEIDDAVFEEIWRVCCFGGFLTGREAARRMLEGEGADEPFAPVPFVWSDQYDCKIQSAGCFHADDEVRIVHGTTQERRFVALQGRKGKLVGAIALNRVRQLMGYRRSIREGIGFEEAVAAAETS